MQPTETLRIEVRREKMLCLFLNFRFFIAPIVVDVTFYPIERTKRTESSSHI